MSTTRWCSLNAHLLLISWNSYSRWQKFTVPPLQTHGMAANFAPVKTEAVVLLGGQHATTATAMLDTEGDALLLPLPPEAPDDDVCYVRLVRDYKHVGTIFHSILV